MNAKSAAIVIRGTGMATAAMMPTASPTKSWSAAMVIVWCCAPWRNAFWLITNGQVFLILAILIIIGLMIKPANEWMHGQGSDNDNRRAGMGLARPDGPQARSRDQVGWL